MKRRPDYRIPASAAKNLDGDTLVWAVIEPMWDDLNFYEDWGRVEKFMKAVTPGQGAMISIWWCESEVCNGGFEQFFSNSTGMLAEPALKGFRLVGADHYSDLLWQAMSIFAGTKRLRNRRKRNEALYAEPYKERLAFLRSLDDQFYKLLKAKKTELFRICVRYIRSHPSEFFLESAASLNG